MSISSMIKELVEYCVEGSEAIEMISTPTRPSSCKVVLRTKLQLINHIRPGYVCNALDDLDAIGSGIGTVTVNN